MRSFRGSFSYANVMATIAVFIALGGGAYALSLERNEVKSKHLARDTAKAKDIATGGVGAAEVADGAVGSAEVADGAVGSAEIADGAVGTSKLADGSVGSGKIADGEVGAADLSAALGFNCPSGTRYFEGSCIETSNRPAAPFDSALADCIDENRRLPDVGQLRGFGLLSDIALAGANEWAEPQYFDADTGGAALFRAPAIGEGTAGGVDASAVPHPYRCVASATG